MRLVRRLVGQRGNRHVGVRGPFVGDIDRQLETTTDTIASIHVITTNLFLSAHRARPSRIDYKTRVTGTKPYSVLPLSAHDRPDPEARAALVSSPSPSVSTTSLPPPPLLPLLPAKKWLQQRAVSAICLCMCGGWVADGISCLVLCWWMWLGLRSLLVIVARSRLDRCRSFSCGFLSMNAPLVALPVLVILLARHPPPVLLAAHPSLRHART